MQNETVKIELEVSNVTGTQIDQYVQLLWHNAPPDDKPGVDL